MDLNVYSVKSNYLGWATFPMFCARNKEDESVVLSYSTHPGHLLNDPYSEGHTLTHKVGHWIGLYHTFQGGCYGGDNVEETAAESLPASKCPIVRNTCPSRPDSDPIHNFMDYTVRKSNMIGS